MFVLGLTGSIAMGKSTVTALFRRQFIPVYDADATVREFLSPNGKAVNPVQELFGAQVVDNRGGIDRAQLGAIVLQSRLALKALEDILHPLVKADRDGFLKRQYQKRAFLSVLDVPLLFETGMDQECHASCVVHCPDFLQRQRALKRDGMTLEKFNLILARQMPTAEKLKRADLIIETGLGKRHSLKRVNAFIRFLSDGGQ